MNLPAGKHWFVSDVHLGVGNDVGALREKTFCDFLDSIPPDAEGLYLLGDIFDFWVDYKSVVPRGFVRVFGRLAALSDRGCRVFFFKGNHDYWVTDYFEKELGICVVDEPYRVMDIAGARVCMGHGDVPGCTDFKARLIFSLFRNRFLISLLRALPSSWVFSFAKGWSSHSRKGNSDYRFELSGSDIEAFALSMGSEQHIDRFIFGHFHRECEALLDCGARINILGDWSDGPSYLNL